MITDPKTVPRVCAWCYIEEATDGDEQRACIEGHSHRFHRRKVWAAVTAENLWGICSERHALEYFREACHLDCECARELSDAEVQALVAGTARLAITVEVMLKGEVSDDIGWKSALRRAEVLLNEARARELHLKTAIKTIRRSIASGEPFPVQTKAGVIVVNPAFEQEHK